MTIDNERRGLTEPLESVTISAVPVRMPSVQPAPFRGGVPEFLNTITPRDLGGK